MRNSEELKMQDRIRHFLSTNSSEKAGDPTLAGLLEVVEPSALECFLARKDPSPKEGELQQDLEAFLLDEAEVDPKNQWLQGLLETRLEEAQTSPPVPAALMSQAQGLSHLLVEVGTPERFSLLPPGVRNPLLRGLPGFLQTWKLPLVALCSLSAVLFVGDAVRKIRPPVRVGRQRTHQKPKPAAWDLATKNAWNDYEVFFQAQEAGDLLVARQALERLLLQESGFRNSCQRDLSRFLLEGLGGSIQPKRGLELARLAAESGDAESQRTYAFYLARGLRKLAWIEEIMRPAPGAPSSSVVVRPEVPNPEVTFANWRYASSQGTGSVEDFREALRWYLRAAAQNDPSAHNSLGWILEAGPEEVRDLDQSRYFFSLAREGRLERSLHNTLGLQAELGAGVVRDPTLAAQLFRNSGSECPPTPDIAGNDADSPSGSAAREPARKAP